MLLLRAFELGTAFCVKQFFPLMRPGSVVVPIVSEIAHAFSSAAFNGPYAMSKFALEVSPALLMRHRYVVRSWMHSLLLLNRNLSVGG